MGHRAQNSVPFAPVEWRRIAGWPYEAGSNGKIRNVRTGRVLRPDVVKGYERVTLSHLGETDRRFVHVLVCEAFNGLAGPLDECARHRNGSRCDNRAENLKWGMHAENEHDKRLHGTAPIGEKNPSSKLTEREVGQIRARYSLNLQGRRSVGFRQVEHGFVKRLAAELGVSASCIKFVISGRNWKDAAA